MPFAYYQRASVKPSDQKEKKKAKHQELEFSDDRDISTSIDALQLKVNNSEHNQSITQLQEKIDNNTGMPDELKDGVENLSGEDMSDVKVTYNSDKPAQLQANAYASGNDIHIAPGQEKSLPHEAWHVVQQKQNRVKPTIKTDSGELINDDPALEKEADVMGEKALQLKSNTRENLSKSSTKNSVAQLDKTSKNAKFSAAEGVQDESGSKTANIDSDAIKAQQAARVTDRPAEEAAKSDEQKAKEKKQNEENQGKKKRVAVVDAKVEELQNQNIYSKNLWENYELGHKYSKAAQLIVDTFDKDLAPEKFKKVEELMTKLNDLSGEKGTIKLPGKAGVVEVTLGEFAPFNLLYIDPYEYLPVKEVKAHLEKFQGGAAKFDKKGDAAGVDFDWGRTDMGERGSMFFAPKGVMESILEDAKKGDGIWDLMVALKLGDYGKDWIDEEKYTEGKNPDNPKDEIYMFIITQNPLKDAGSIFEGKIPRGYEGGAYANEWKAGGFVPVADKPDAPAQNLVNQTQEKSAQPIPEVAVKPLTKEKFLELLEADKVQMKVISLPTTEKKGMKKSQGEN